MHGNSLPVLLDSRSADTVLLVINMWIKSICIAVCTIVSSRYERNTQKIKENNMKSLLNKEHQGDNLMKTKVGKKNQSK